MGRRERTRNVRQNLHNRKYDFQAEYGTINTTQQEAGLGEPPSITHTIQRNAVSASTAEQNTTQHKTTQYNTIQYNIIYQAREQSAQGLPSRTHKVHPRTGHEGPKGE
jgi:hypothetical protein